MKRTLVIVTDLGNFRAFEWDGDNFHSTPRLELVDDFETIDARHKRGNTLTVHEQRAVLGNPSDGEQHNMQLEKRRRLVRQMAERVTDLLRPKDIDRCFLAAPAEINRQLVVEISTDVRQKIQKNLPLDLTRLDKSQLIDHFFERVR
jgi:protein required for attachment to host cells